MKTKKPKAVKVVGESIGFDVIEVYSESNPNRTYRVDVKNGRCSCPAWVFQRGGIRKPCKHLRALGFTETVYHVPRDVNKGLRAFPKSELAYSPRR